MFALIFLFLGLIVGSFLSVVSYRLPGKKQFLSGRSRCPNCGKKVAWYDNIPLVSYILLKGRCRNCGREISLRYPTIEMATALLFVSLYWAYSACSSSPICFWKGVLGPFSLIFLLFAASLVILVFTIDLEKRIIPDELNFLGFGITSLLLLFSDRFYESLLAGALAALFLLSVHLLTKGKGMGLGDVKFALFAGVFFGWPMAVVWLFTAFLTGAAVAIILILLGKAGRGDKIAFGPFLAISFVMTMFWGDKIISAILR